MSDGSCGVFGQSCAACGRQLDNHLLHIRTLCKMCAEFHSCLAVVIQHVLRLQLLFCRCLWQVSTLPPIQVHYDSSEALYLRKALNPRFAPHRTILRQSANPGEAYTHPLPTVHSLQHACFGMKALLPDPLSTLKVQVRHLLTGPLPSTNMLPACSHCSTGD
jgi:hypothetical protein